MRLTARIRSIPFCRKKSQSSRFPHGVFSRERIPYFWSHPWIGFATEPTTSGDAISWKAYSSSTARMRSVLMMPIGNKALHISMILSILASFDPLAVHTEDLETARETGIAEPAIISLVVSNGFPVFLASAVDVVYREGTNIR